MIGHPSTIANLDLKVDLFADFHWLTLASGDPHFQVLETESSKFPHKARHGIEDHITVVGRWLFDDCHPAKTEIHPIQTFESDRIGYRPLYLGSKLQPVKLVRVWMNSSPSAFDYKYTVPLNFSIQLPSSAGKFPFIRNVKAELLYADKMISIPTAIVTSRIDGSKVHVSIVGLAFRPKSETDV